jgi:tRNA-specific 2-thiouridylase
MSPPIAISSVNGNTKISTNKRRVAVAMSGGVDSSVAAALLLEQGYDVIGMMMRLWSEPGSTTQTTLNRCCTPEQMADARRVAEKLQIPFYVLDVQEYFYKKVVQYFIQGHDLGITPNPCIECNRVIRFDYLLKHALSLGVDYLATGHYARIRQSSDGYHLLESVDRSKDQSYVLHVLGQNELARIIFPIGEFTKVQVRELAVHFQIPVANKSESMDLCFLKDGDYRRFLRENSKVTGEPGPIISPDGVVLGKHSGLSNYTIGQRKGLQIMAEQPMYVLRKDRHHNSLIVAPRVALNMDCLHCREINWVSSQLPISPFPARVKVRYRAEATPAMVTPLASAQASIRFEDPVFGITAGQGAVIYIDEECIGGGIIVNKECP